MSKLQSVLPVALGVLCALILCGIVSAGSMGPPQDRREDQAEARPDVPESDLQPGAFKGFLRIYGAGGSASLELADWDIENRASSLRFLRRRQSKFMIGPDGDVGIGTAAPLAELHVQGRGRVAEILLAPEGENSSSRLSLCQDPSCDDAAQLRYDGSRDALYLYFKDAAGSGFARDRIAWTVEHHANSSARVGINLPRDHDIRNALEVNGKILAEEIEVVVEAADHVFEAGYELMPLAEVDSFVRRHHHLPGIQSRAELSRANRAMALGQGYSRLLEKIEELTLHAIAQERRIAALEQEVQRLSGREEAER